MNSKRQLSDLHQARLLLDCPRETPYSMFLLSIYALTMFMSRPKVFEAEDATSDDPFPFLHMEWLDLGYGALFLATFLAATVIPLSSEAVLAGMLATGFDPLLCLVIATSGNTLGGMSSYYLGRLADYHKLERWLGIKEQRVLKWKHYSDRYGPYLALISWAPFFGDVIAVALGVFKVSWPPVLWWMLLGKFLRFLIAISLMGYFIHQQPSL